MNGRSLAAGTDGVETGVLDHAREFVELVHREAPVEYRALLKSGRYKKDLGRKSNFNFGKLFVYAEFVVFRREFRERFPESTPVACINAFSGLFLKNDISITNLVTYLEGSDDREQLLKIGTAD